MHFIDIKPHDNNKEIYKINTLLNTIEQFEPPHAKREFPQCMRCQKFGHTKTYCRNNPRCVKCTAEHLTNDCPRNVRDDNVKCFNCNEKHPANYRGCAVHKQLQQKIYPIKGAKYSNKIDPLRSNIYSGSSWTNRNTPNKCNSAKTYEHDKTRE